MRQLSREFHPRPSATRRSNATEDESATGGNRPGAGAAPVPKPKTPRSKPGFSPAGRRLTKRGFVFDALFVQFREAKDNFTNSRNCARSASPSMPCSSCGSARAVPVSGARRSPWRQTVRGALATPRSRRPRASFRSPWVKLRNTQQKQMCSAHPPGTVV
jgi:hypothetical protein